MDLASLLPQFSAGPDLPTPMPEVDCEAEIREVELRAEEERASLVADYEQRLADLESRHQAEMESARQQWCEHQAVEISADISRQINGRTVELSECIARAMQPFLRVTVREAALIDFCSKASEAIAGELQAAVKLSGPADLVEACRSELQARGISGISCTPAEQLGATIADEHLQSNLKSWLAALQDTCHG